MLSRNHVTILILLTAILVYTGVAGLRHPSSSHPTSSPAKPPAIRHRASAPKAAAHDSPFSTYNNPDYALSFRYPRTFSLSEDLDFGDDSSLQPQQQLAVEQPGILLLASVEIPDDAYPNTTFLSGHLQLAVDPAVPEPVCLSLASQVFDRLNDSGTAQGAAVSGTAGVEAIHGMVFHWRQSHNFANQTDSFHRNYFAYSNGACYEFFLQVTAIAPALEPALAPATAPVFANSAEVSEPSAVANSAEPQPHPVDSSLKPANELKILRSLEKIVSTFQVRGNP